MKQQLLIINRSRRRAPNLTSTDRMLLGFWSLFLSPHHIERAAVILRPSTLLNFHAMLKRRKYRLFYTSRRKGRPGPKGPSPELIDAIVEMKRRNSRFGCPRIAQELNKALGADINKDVVRRVLENHYHPAPDSGNGPSWLTFIGHLKDSLWSTGGLIARGMYPSNPLHEKPTDDGKTYQIEDKHHCIPEAEVVNEQR
jgi:putative transposase